MDERWKNEPDTFDFESHGLACAMRRGPGGHWCGYVRVGPEHPWFGKKYSDPIMNPPAELVNREIDIDKVGAINVFAGSRHGSDLSELCDLVLLVDVHGGLTYSRDYCPGGEADGWWFGFDCTHSGDFSPEHGARGIMTDGVYRDAEYVRGECESLARQLSAVAAIARAEVGDS